MSDELKRRAHSVGQSYYHLMWCPKYRLKIFNNPKIKRLCEFVLKMIAKEENYIVHAMEVMEDHIHVFIEIPPTQSLSQVFQKLKGRSSYILGLNYPRLRTSRGVIWARSKFYRSVGSVTKEAVQRYVEHSRGEYTF